MFFEKLFKQLNKKKIKYMVIGGVAVNLHGFPRTTGDLDILISLKPNNVRKFIQLVKSLKWKPKIPVHVEEFANPKTRKAWIQEKGMKVFSVYNPKNQFEHLDIMVENYIDFESAFHNKKVISAGTVKVPVISIKDLIKLKKIAGRERDIIDINALIQIKELSE